MGRLLPHPGAHRRWRARHGAGNARCGRGELVCMPSHSHLQILLHVQSHRAHSRTLIGRLRVSLKPYSPGCLRVPGMPSLSGGRGPLVPAAGPGGRAMRALTPAAMIRHPARMKIRLTALREIPAAEAWKDRSAVPASPDF